MARRWQEPIYRLTAKSGKKIEIDVTLSISAGLEPNSVVTKTVIPIWRDKGVNAVLDFGAGALRHTIPFLSRSFRVCAVEFERAFERPVAKEKLKKAKKNANFSALIWPHEFEKSRTKFDAAMLCYVLQTMPHKRDRKRVLRYIYQKLTRDGYVLYMSRYGQVTKLMRRRRVEDGYYMSPSHRQHSFYTEFNCEKTDRLFESCGFDLLKSLGRGGSEQIYIYGKGGSMWI